MSTSKETESHILRLHHAEGWRPGTIAAQLGVHTDVVNRVLGRLAPRQSRAARPLLITAHAAYVDEILKQYPRLRATRVFHMLKARGYSGSIRTLRDHVARVRPEPAKRAYLRLNPLIGQQSQIDWAHIGKVKVSGGERSIWAFVMVLSYSRAMWAELVYDLTAASLRRSLLRASQYFGGCTRQWLFDNPKTVVIERHGSATRFHPELVDVASALFVETRLCGVYEPQHKGRVERSIRYLRERYFAGRSVQDIEVGNASLLTFIRDIAHERPHPAQADRRVREVFDEERARLVPLPAKLPTQEAHMPVRVDKTAFVRFDTNDYSVPSKFAHQTLTLAACDRAVRILDGGNEVAHHVRNWGRRQQIEDHSHHASVTRRRRAGRAGKGYDRMRALIPRIDMLIERWVNDGRNPGSMTHAALSLLNTYGDAVFAAAANELIDGPLHDTGAMALLCEKHRKNKQRPIILESQLPNHVRDRDVVPHALENYDG